MVEKRTIIPSDREHDHKIDAIRAVAIITVMFGHSIILYSSSWNLYKPEYSCQVLNVAKRIINLYQMPLFFSLSGYLFAKSSRFVSPLDFFLKKAKRILVPFLIVGFLWMIPIKYVAHYPLYSEVSYIGASKMFLEGTDTGHLWYLPTLFICFGVAYATSKLFKNGTLTWTLMTISGLAVYSFKRSIPEMSVISVYLRYFAEYFWSFSLGALIITLRDFISAKLTPKLKRIAACSAVVICFIEIFLAVLVYESLMLPAAASIIITLYLVIPDREFGIAKSLSRNSYGMYLFHSPLIYATFLFALDYPPVIVVSINFLVWGSVAYFMTVAIRKTPLKLIIGE